MSQSLKRGDDIVKSLCEDALKRQKTLHESPPKGEPEKPQKESKKDSAYIASCFVRRFQKEFKIADPSNRCCLDRVGLAKLLSRFGCIKTESSDDKKLWKYLTSSSGATTVSKDDVYNALAEILLIPPQCEQSEKLHKQFYHLYIMYTLTGKGTYEAKGHKSSLSQDFTFRPKLSQKTKALATARTKKETFDSIT